MAVSKEMRFLLKKWGTGQGWPKRLEALEIRGLRGWTGQRIDFDFPIVALVGENGAGKSTILQSAASIYKPPEDQKGKFASAYFPETAWEKIPTASIRWWVREGHETKDGSVRKFPGKWRGNPDRRERVVRNIDLSRIQPVSARVGYQRLAKAQAQEASSTPFDADKLEMLSTIMNRDYEVVSMALTTLDANREVPVIAHEGSKYSGFNGGAGETTMTEFVMNEIPNYSLVLIDEIETSLHPRAQRRLVRKLAEMCRVKELQIIVSTHSPYVLAELPENARLYIWKAPAGREIIKGVSPEFAMTKMDLEIHPECDIYVEDDEARILLREVLVALAPDLISRSLVVPYGAASVGQALGQMAEGKKFPRATCVFLDGDQDAAVGCMNLPGGDAPERVVFEALKEKAWAGVAQRVGRQHSALVDACEKVMTVDDHHEWISLAADELVLGGENLWQAMCAVWAASCLDQKEGKKLVEHIQLVME